MPQSLKSFAAGTVSGALTCDASICALAHTSAFVMPRGFPVALWIAVAVFGLGAASVAFLIHFVAIRILAAMDLPAFIGFALTVAVVLAVTGLLANGGNAPLLRGLSGRGWHRWSAVFWDPTSPWETSDSACGLVDALDQPFRSP